MSRRAPAAPLAAYVLHRWDWSETSLILDLFTRELGRVAVAAKGAKRPYSQLRSVLLPFQRVAVQLGRTPADDAGEVHTLRSAEWLANPTVLRGAALFPGFYLNELLMKLLARHDPHPALFDAYAATLSTLAAADDAASQAALRAFELVLLRQTGLLPALDRMTATLAPLRGEDRVALEPEGGVVERGDAMLEGRVLVRLEAALAGPDLAALQAACAPALGALRVALRALLHYHLGSVQPLRTRAVMLDVQKLLDR